MKKTKFVAQLHTGLSHLTQQLSMNSSFQPARLSFTVSDPLL